MCLYRYRQIQPVHMYISSSLLYSCLTSTLERQKQHIVELHIAIAYFPEYLSVCVIISMNYTENVTKNVQSLPNISPCYSLYASSAYVSRWIIQQNCLHMCKQGIPGAPLQFFRAPGNEATEDLGKWIVHLHEVFEKKCSAVKAHWSWYFTPTPFSECQTLP